MVLPKMSIRLSAIRSKYARLFGFGILVRSIYPPSWAFNNYTNCFPFAAQIPQHYTCFCNKELNPVNHLWLVPHSCGELCEKPLKSQHGLCSHHCMILCHPGPCPPCSQTIATSCECKKSNLRTIRCVQQSWKCGNKVCVCAVQSLKISCLLILILVSIQISVQNCLPAVYIHAMSHATRNVHRVRRRANSNACVAIKHRSVIAAAWCGHAKKRAINYMNVDDTDAKSNAMVVTAARVRRACWDHARAAKR